MVTCNSAATMDQTANVRVVKANEGTATGNEWITKAQEGTVSAKGKEPTVKDKDGVMKGKEQASVWTDDEVELLLRLHMSTKQRKRTRM